MVYKGHHSCGGSLLNSDTVLTAAHCLLETNPQNPDGKLIKIQIDKLTVILGTIYNVSSEKEENRQTSQVKNEISHPAYDEKTFDNDFAILKLSTPVKFTKYVNPICLPESSNLNLDSVEAMVSGWGVNYGLDVTSFPAILQKVKRNNFLALYSFSMVPRFNCLNAQYLVACKRIWSCIGYAILISQSHIQI